jgi:hypothetical protein
LTFPELTIDPDETIARRIVQDLVEGDTEPWPVRFTGLDLVTYDSISLKVRRNDLSGFSRTLVPNGTQAYVEDTTTTFPCADQDGLTVILAVDGGSNQTVTFSGVTTSLSSVLSQLNAQLTEATALDNGSGQLRIRSDSGGENSSVSAPTGTSVFSWDTPVAGTGDAELGYVTWQSTDLIVDRSEGEFEFTLGSTVFTLPRRFPIDLSIRRDLG